MGPANPRGVGPKVVPKDRLDSWKAIATYLDRDIRTVQRWERLQSLPIHRIPGGSKAGVFASRAELDTWLESNVAAVRPARWKKLLWIPAVVVCVAGAVAVSLRVASRNPSFSALPESGFTPFAISLPVQVCPAWSPDGRSIAFTTRMNGQGRLMVQALEGSAPVPVTAPDTAVLGGGDPVWCRQPLWTRDSQWLYFIGTHKHAFGLYRIAAGGVADPILVQPRTQAAALSPDGNSLVSFGRESDHSHFRIWVSSPPESPRKLYEPAAALVDAATFANVPQLAFSPDGKTILAILTLDGGNRYLNLPWPPAKPKLLFPESERAVGVARISWMPDSRHLIASARGMLMAASVAAGTYWPIAAQDRPMNSPTPSPDGSRVAYQSMLSHSDVIAVPLDGGPVETLAGTNAWEQMPAASPMSPQIVYNTVNHGHHEVRLKDFTGSNSRLLASATDLDVNGKPVQLIFTPVFSPDATRLAFAARSAESVALFTMQIAGGIPTRVTSARDPGLAPTWSPDGHWLAYRTTVGERYRLMKVRIGAPDPPIDLAPSCGQTMPEWSPNGKWIAHPGEQCEVTLISPDAKTTLPIGGLGPVAWSRDGRTLYRIDMNRRTLAAIEIPSRRERILRDLGDLLPYSGPQPGLRASLTHDGRSIVYSVLRPREEIWILEKVNTREPWTVWLRSLWPS